MSDKLVRLPPPEARGLSSLRDSVTGSIEIYDWHVVTAQLETTLETLGLQDPRNLMAAMGQLDEIMRFLPADMGVAKADAARPEHGGTVKLLAKIFGIFSSGLREITQNAEKKQSGEERLALLKRAAGLVAELREKIDYEISNAAEGAALVAKDEKSHSESLKTRQELEALLVDIRQIRNALADPAFQNKTLAIGSLLGKHTLGGFNPIGRNIENMPGLATYNRTYAPLKLT